METYKDKRTIQYKNYVQIFPINEELFAFKHDLIVFNKLTSCTTKLVTQGLTTREQFESWKTKDYSDIPQNKSYVVATEELLERMRLYGWISIDSDNEYRVSSEEWKKGISKYPFLHIQRSGYKVVQFLTGSNQLRDTNDEYLPVALRFNYLYGHYDNAHYDLEKAIKILENNPAIVLFNEDGEIAKGNKVISRIPHYNSDSVCNKALYFLWQPTKEDYQKLMEQCSTYGDGSHPSTNIAAAIFDMDLFGLRVGGAALFDKYYAHKEFEETADNDGEREWRD
jgi:hypothetical protein